MAVEDQRYDEVIKAVNALVATGRKEMVRVWLLDLAMQIIKRYGKEEKKDG